MLFFEYFQIGHLALILILVQSYVVFCIWEKSKSQTRFIKEAYKEVQALLSCERGMADRIKNQQQQMHGITERQDQLEISETSQVNYKQAIALMKKGATASEMVEACDISRGELELISRLQQQKTPSLKTRAA